MKWKSIITLLFAFLALIVGFSAAGQQPGSASDAYTFTTLAGYSSSGTADGVGNLAQFNLPEGVAVDANGNVFVADTGNHTIRKITPAGIVTTIAGFGNIPGSADGANSTARFNLPAAVALDSAGNLYVADTGNSTIRKITPSGADWVVTTIAGLAGTQGTNDGMGTAALFYLPSGISVDVSNNVYVADDSSTVRNGSLLKILASPTIRQLTPVGTNWNVSTLYDEGFYRNFNGFFGITQDKSGDLFVPYIELTQGHSGVGGLPGPPAGQVLKLAPPDTNLVVTSIVGSGVSGSSDGNGDNAQFGRPTGIVRNGQGDLFLTDSYFLQIRKLTPSGTNWNSSTVAGSPLNQGIADGVGTNAQFGQPQGLAIDAANNLYVADTANNSIRQVTSAGEVRTIAGAVGSQGSADGISNVARFNAPRGITVDNQGNVYVADTGNQTIREITAAGNVFTVAGSAGLAGSTNDIGSNARFWRPYGVVVDPSGNLYVADSINDVIRKITPAGVVSTIAGTLGVQGTNNGIGTSASFGTPQGIALDRSGSLYVTDTSGLIRKVSPSGPNWVVSTLAGVPGALGYKDGTGTNAIFAGPVGISADDATNLYVADSINNAIRKITPLISAGVTNWVVSTIAGNPNATVNDTDGAGTNALFAFPQQIAVDHATNLYVTDAGSNTVRKLTLVGTNWMVSTIGGMSSTTGSTDGAGSAALFNNPSAITVDNQGNLYLADTGNNTIRKGVFTQYGSANTAAFSRPALNGQLRVTLLPPQANGQWRFPWEVAWHNSGYTATHLAAGNYPVEFRNLPGWLAIPAGLTSTNPAVVAANGVSQITNTYYPSVLPSDAGAAAGSLTVNLGANPPTGAGWRFLGDTTPFLASNFTTNLLPGTYLIQFAGPFNGRSTPPNASIQILSGQPTLISVSYPFASAPPSGAFLPTPVPANQVSDVTDYPFGFNGQLQTDVGYGSGVVAQSNVVLTAAHLVFNDQALSYVSGAYFFLQENAPFYTPSPLTVRGWYVLSGYAAQRTNDLNSGNYGPDVSSPQSRNLDVAALYFQSPVAGGSYGGYLPSDDVPNQWLTGNAEKMLVGYPVDGSQFGFANIVPGTMYQTDPQPFPLSLDTESVTNQQEVYTAPWFLSYPGNSGGPLYVQLNGYYYPAAVYLGTLNGQSVVRGIDSNVVNLITLAAALGDSGTNNNGGGVITIIPNQSISAFNPGYLQVQLGPPAAVQAGAAWLLQPSATYSTATNFTQVIFSTNAVSLQFKPIPGWNVPTNQSVVVVPGNISTPAATYTVLSPTLLANAQGIGLQGTTNTTYRIETTASLNPPVWIGLTTNTIVSSGFNLVVPAPANPATTFYRAVWLNK